MQQRQLRLGDILDDYCPRERRLANHTIVAMVGDDIRLTRCTTCDTEHPYKGGKAPRLRKKKTSVEAAYDEVLESVKHEAPPQGVLVTHPEPEEPEPRLTALERTRTAGCARAQRQRQRARADGARRGAAASTVDPRAAAAHRARGGGAAGARIHHPPGEQEPRTISKQLQPGPLCEGRRSRWHFARSCRTSRRPPGRPAAGPRLADALAPARTEEAIQIASNSQFSIEN